MVTVVSCSLSQSSESLVSSGKAAVQRSSGIRSDSGSLSSKQQGECLAGQWGLTGPCFYPFFGEQVHLSLLELGPPSTPPVFVA